MTIVISDKKRIHYRFEGDKGAYLLLHHGLFGSHQDWYDAGYVEALRGEFRLILMDARGHGRSDHPLQPEAYRLAAMADDVVAIMNELEIRNLHFCGYSLGALVGYELLMRHPERVRIVMLAGESPFVSEAMQAEWRDLAQAIQADGLAAVRERLLAEQRLVADAGAPEQEGERDAALALLESLAAEPIRPDEGRVSVDSPVALFIGEDDPALGRVRDARRRIHRARFVSFPGLTHAGLFREREALTAEILRLLRPGRRTREGAEGEERAERGGRGRGPQGRENGQRARVPLTPPPPVEVPARPAESGRERAPAEETAPEHPTPPPPETDPPVDPPLAREPVPEPDAAAAEAPDDIGVRARQEAPLSRQEPAGAEPGDWPGPDEAALDADMPDTDEAGLADDAELADEAEPADEEWDDEDAELPPRR